MVGLPKRVKLLVMLIYGRNPVRTALQQQRVEELLIARGVEPAFARQMRSLAKEAGVRVKELSRIELDQLAGTTAHQGVMAQAHELEWAEVDQIWARAAQQGVALP